MQGYSDINIIFKLDKMIENDTNLLSKSQTLVKLLRCYATFDCKSLRWDDLILPALKDNLTAGQHGGYLSEITMMLILLGHSSTKAVQTVLSSAFLNQHITQRHNQSNVQATLKAIYWYAKLTQRDDAVKYYISDLTSLQRMFDDNRKLHRPLDKVISEEIGEKKILNYVSTRNGGLWNMVKVNKNTKELVDIQLEPPADNAHIPVGDIIVEPDEQL